MERPPETMHQHTSLEEFFKKDAAVLDRIYAEGMSRYAESLPDIQRAFELNSRTLRCIDERIEQDGISLAGSGILLDEKKALEVVKRAHVTGITSHQGCGAVKLACEQRGIDVVRSEEEAVSWAKHLAELAELPYEGHIALDDMKRPPDAHIARVIYYDGSGRLALSKKKELPVGFILSRKYLDPAYAKDELGVAISIALGDHGFGELITPDEPLVVIPIANDEKTLSELEQEIASVAEKFEGRVISSGFTIPA